VKIIDYPAIGEQIYSSHLPNGLPVFVVPKRDFNKKIAYLAVNYGGNDRRFLSGNTFIDTPAGVAHFLEHKMFDTENGSVINAFSSKGASPNAFTSNEVTAYHFECIDDFHDNLKLLLNFVSTPYFTAENIEKEKGIITQEICMAEDDPDHRLYYGILKALFSHHPIRDSIAGTQESVEQITEDVLSLCHNMFYKPSNMALCVVGDVQPDKIYEIADKLLLNENVKPPVRDYGPPETLLPQTKEFHATMDVSLPIFLTGCKSNVFVSGIDKLRLELIAALSLEILAGHSSPLYINLYSQGLVNSDFSASFDMSHGVAYTLFGGESSDPLRVTDEVCREINKLTSNNIDTNFLNRVKKATLGSHVRALNSFSAICSGLIFGYFNGYDPFESMRIVSSITEDDITKFIKENLIIENMAFSVITPN
jgi:predicted Zn-dependent peptidase